MIRALQPCRFLRLPTTFTSGLRCKLLSQKCEENKSSDYYDGSGVAGLTNTVSDKYSFVLKFSRAGQVVATSSNFNQVCSNCSESKGSFGINFKFNKSLHQKTFVRTFTSTQSLNNSTSEKKIVKKRMVSDFIRRRFE